MNRNSLIMTAIALCLIGALFLVIKVSFDTIRVPDIYQGVTEVRECVFVHKNVDNVYWCRLSDGSIVGGRYDETFQANSK